MEVTAPGRMFTQAARRAWTMARAMRLASAALAHVTRTIHLSVKKTSRPVTLSRLRHFHGASHLHGRLQYLPEAGNILVSNGSGLYVPPAKINDGDDQIWNFGLARDHRG